MQTAAVNLTNCDKEPIHIPGRVQAHGFLLALHKDTRQVLYASSNTAAFTGIAAVDLLSKSVQQLVALTGMKMGSAGTDIIQVLSLLADTTLENINPLKITIKDQPLHLIVHRSDDLILLEFEPMDGQAEHDLQKMIGASVSRILEARTLQATLENAARQVKAIIGYDRVMLYKFWEDGHGEVVAEEKNADLEPFLGLHYPATDIPQQARALYKINLVRIIADVHTPAADLLVTDPRYATKPLDLTHAELRAVSPIHIEYLKNMGVASSFSVSIIVNNELWGLIACHNYSPKFIDYNARNSARLIGKILSSSLEYRQDEEKKESLRHFDGVLQQVLKNSTKNWDVASGLTNTSTGLLQLTNASGVALFFEGQSHLMGNTPTNEQVEDLFKWILDTGQPTLFHTDKLGSLYPAASMKDTASGILCCILSREMKEGIIWFKPEIKKMVNWAGNPNKPLEKDAAGNDKISPRKSFAMWSEQVEGSSAPWSAGEVRTVMKLREELLNIINEKAHEIRKLNEQLKKAYEELDTFSYTISHDLKTPLASIRNYTEIVLEDFPDLPEQVNDMLGKVVKSTTRMNLLIKEVLFYSRIGRQDIELVKLNMEQIITQAQQEVLSAYNNKKVVFLIEGTPALKGDSTMISQVFTNLISNAVKYSGHAEHPRVEVKGIESDDEIIYTIADNGIGIDMRYGSQVFDLFRRLDNAKAFEGTGVGLAIARRIVEKHRGKIWYESELQKGTVFYLSFKK
ncbi:MAG: ATP-binding protein [Chitinophagaceae bacterium]